ncbi:MAG: NADPH-dependent 7-cyano-7-deazaguanine reductase QueF [Spongiibacteraceae bacterium]
MVDKSEQTLLGKDVAYADTYSPQLLFPISREASRESLGISSAKLPFTGVDIWNAYELSWLNQKGKPCVAHAEFRFACESVSIVESKSFKLYLNSLNQTRFDSVQQLQQILVDDLSACVGVAVVVTIQSLDHGSAGIDCFEGECLDSLDIEVENYSPDPACLNQLVAAPVEEGLYSHLLRSLCPVTGQPDWGSVLIEYKGAPIDRQGLLKYIVGYRQHQEFHEQCVERIFCDLSARCHFESLSVYARYVRRGGLDINPFRCSAQREPKNLRLVRQ